MWSLQTDDVELDVAASSSEDVVVDVVADDTRAWLRQHCPALLMEGQLSAPVT